jgi:hypothetical protein
VITNVCFTVRLLDGQFVRRRMRTPPGKQLAPEGLEALLVSEAKRVEEHFPGREFRLVPLHGGNFNFVELDSSSECDPTNPS